MNLTGKKLQSVRHALYELEAPLVRQYPPSERWWSAWRLLVKLFGKHEVENCVFCKVAD